MLQKIISLLDKLENTPLYSVLSKVEINSLLKIAGFQLTSGIGRLKLASINVSEVRVLLTALENQDVAPLRESDLAKSLYALLTFEDIRMLLNKGDILPELTGLVEDSIPFEVALDCVDLFTGPASKKVLIKDNK